MHSRIPLITGLLVSLALAGQNNAQASGRSDAAIAGVVAGAVIGGVIASSRPAPVYQPAPAPPVVVYYPQQPVYYAPPPPAQVYYYPAPPVVVAPGYRPYPPPPHYRHGGWRHDGRW